MALGACRRGCFPHPNRSSDFREIARLCHAACFWPSRRRSEEQDAGRSGQDARKHHFRHRKRPGESDGRFGLNGFRCLPAGSARCLGGRL